MTPFLLSPETLLSSAKLVKLDKLLRELKERGSRWGLMLMFGGGVGVGVGVGVGS